MEKDQFLRVIADQFEQTDKSLIVENCIFKELQEWDSMVALCIISALDDEFGIIIGGNEINQSKTLLDLYKLIQHR
jgi:acyl carrier protein